MKILATCLVAVFVLSGCAAIQIQRHEAAFQRANEIAAECRQKRLSGILPNNVASAQCSNPRMGTELAKVNYPYMDLINLWLAYRTALAKRIDDGETPEAEANLPYAEFMTRLNSEVYRRNAALQQSAALRAASYNNVMQGLAAWQRVAQPQQRIITCTTFGNITTCN